MPEVLEWEIHKVIFTPFSHLKSQSPLNIIKNRACLPVSHRLKGGNFVQVI